MNPKPRSTSIAIVVSIIFAFSGSLAVSGSTTGSKWARYLKKTEALLIAEKYTAARRVALKTTKEMVDSLGPGQNASYALGLTLAFRSVAEVGLGNREDALWYWHVALSIHPQLKDMDLSLYGEPEVFLKGKTLAESTRCSPCLCQDCADFTQDLELEVGKILPPKVRKKPKLVYPYAARHFRISGTVVVQVLVQKNGSVSHPRVVESLPASTLVYTALEAIKEWDFEPARLDGEPVAVYYNLTVNFRLQSDMEAPDPDLEVSKIHSFSRVR